MEMRQPFQETVLRKLDTPMDIDCYLVPVRVISAKQIELLKVRAGTVKLSKLPMI